VLLDKGSDHSVRTALGERCSDVAGSAGHTQVVRLIEARTCPFVSDGVSVIVPGWFSSTVAPRWLAVHRARPWDSPQTSRSEVLAYLYSSKEEPEVERILVRPRVANICASSSSPASEGPQQLLEFELLCEAQKLGRGRRRAVPSPFAQRSSSLWRPSTRW
jgi:hypothetical protein